MISPTKAKPVKAWGLKYADGKLRALAYLSEKHAKMWCDDLAAVVPVTITEGHDNE